MVFRVGIDKSHGNLAIQGLEGASMGRQDVMLTRAEKSREKGTEFLIGQFDNLWQIESPLKPPQHFIERPLLVRGYQERPISVAQ